VNGPKVRVRAIAGTYVVFLAFDMAEADTNDLMGFAIQRTRVSDGETRWLRGNKRFPGLGEATGYEDAESDKHPFQTFQWADYSAEPDQTYRYRVIPTSGPPGALIHGPATTVTISTETEAGTGHDVHWNRGAIASQAFVKRFPNKTYDEAGDPAKEWLARDLLPGMLDFIALAADSTWTVHAAIYELRWDAVLDALRAAHLRGAEVRIVYHALADSTGDDNRKHIDATNIKGLTIPRTNTKIMHNKFIVLSQNGVPSSVWSGSTNLSENALFGQLNVGHVIHDPAVARKFEDYWDALRDDLDDEAMKLRTEQITPTPIGIGSDPITPLFSPRKGRAVFDWWIEQGMRLKPLFMTFPFGIVKDFRPVFNRRDDVLRFALLDKYVNGGTAASRQAAIDEIEAFRRYANIGLSLGSMIFVDWLDGWHLEHRPLGTHVNWVHTKFMLIDPLGSKPTTLSGSANWSEGSVTDNDENMLVIRGDKRVADIYFGEFMRLFAHHRFREAVKRWLDDGGPSEELWRPRDLFVDPNKWVPDYFRVGSEHYISRRYFAGVA
jgi:phosphatidylserine/phosphatidylglycerophosphate/cardiolipin synthase-like enzyme